MPAERWETGWQRAWGASEKPPQGGSERNRRRRRRRPRQSAYGSRARARQYTLFRFRVRLPCVCPSRSDRHNTIKQNKQLIYAFCTGDGLSLPLTVSLVRFAQYDTHHTRPNGDDDYAYAARRPGAPTAEARPVVTTHCPGRASASIHATNNIAEPSSPTQRAPPPSRPRGLIRRWAENREIPSWCVPPWCHSADRRRSGRRPPPCCCWPRSCSRPPSCPSSRPPILNVSIFPSDYHDMQWRCTK